MTIKGNVEKIIYQNDKNGYIVFRLVGEDVEIVCNGSCAGLGLIKEGERLILEGEIVVHPTYLEQFKVSSFTIVEDRSAKAIIKYLSSGNIKGVGEKLAQRIVDYFKEETIEVIENEPERLSKIKGISDTMAMSIAAQYARDTGYRNIVMKLAEYDIGENLIRKLYNKYGDGVVSVIQANPYRLVDEVTGVGFKTADAMAMQMGGAVDSDMRTRSAIVHLLNTAMQNGHTCFPKESLRRHLENLLECEVKDFDEHITELAMQKKIYVESLEEEMYLYSRIQNSNEEYIASKLYEMNNHYEANEERLLGSVRAIARGENITLNDIQEQAIMASEKNDLLIITGGPGTGKTTIINCIIKLQKSYGHSIALGAPTGRAAKRMEEATGCKAFTLHRLLGYMQDGSGDEEDETNSYFDRNEANPLEQDVIIIDEMSMVDTFLMRHLLEATVSGQKLIMVGDVNQLPSVGAGNVLKDLIESGSITTIKLEKVYRQDAQSDIVENAHIINEGNRIDFQKKSKDFFLTRRNNELEVLNEIVKIASEKMPAYLDIHHMDVQVMSPMKKGRLGVENLNRVLQEAMNPKADNKREFAYRERIYRQGDKVMQIKNNYNVEWEIRGVKGNIIETGKGVYNGDVGIIKRVDIINHSIEVEFDDYRIVLYDTDGLAELELAYAITVHKSQGSEYPAVIMPVFNINSFLANRKILYTAVTRAKRCVCLVGSENNVKNMIDNNQEVTRYTGLKRKIARKYNSGLNGQS